MIAANQKILRSADQTRFWKGVPPGESVAEKSRALPN